MLEPIKDTTAALMEAMTSRGYHITYQRSLIINAVCQTGQLDNVEDLWLQLRKNSRIGIATVYANIHLLIDKGWLVKQPCGTYLLAV